MVSFQIVVGHKMSLAALSILRFVVPIPSDASQAPRTCHVFNQVAHALTIAGASRPKVHVLS